MFLFQLIFYFLFAYFIFILLRLGLGFLRLFNRVERKKQEHEKQRTEYFRGGRRLEKDISAQGKIIEERRLDDDKK